MRTRGNGEAALSDRGESLHTAGRAFADLDGDAIEIAFVNNMPDQAVETSQAEFMRLLQAGAGDASFRLRCYQLHGVPRSEEMRDRLARTHEDIDALFSRGADALIVTGAEPNAALLTEEPFWPCLARLVDWAREQSLSSLWSCLSAHAAVQRLDGIVRRRGVEKVGGVYSFEPTVDDWSMRGAGPTILVPHSRYNGLDRDDLELRGYNISSWAESVGVDTFWRREPSLFLFLQGHPEYYAETLSREYRRDVIRFFLGERDAYPRVPENYFTPRTRARLENIRIAALTQGRSQCEEALKEALFNEKLELRWSGDAARLCRNLLALVARERGPADSQCAKK